MINDTLPSQICSAHYGAFFAGQNLRELVNSRVPAPRPLPAMQPQSISFIGGETIKIRRPDIGETALSPSEIEIAISEGISAQTAGEGVA